MKVSELQGAELDCAVAQALGYKAYKEKRGQYELCVIQAPSDREPWKSTQNSELAKQRYTPVSLLEAVRIGFFGVGVPKFTKDWAISGPLIEREKIPLCPVIGGTWAAEYVCWIGEDDCDTTTVYGPTPLIAACRAFVASRFGDELPTHPAAQQQEEGK